MKKFVSYIMLTAVLAICSACSATKEDKAGAQETATMTGVYYVGVDDTGEVFEVPSGKGKTIMLRAYANEGEVSDLFLTITFKADPAAAEAYNAAHGTSYVMCPGSAYEFTTPEAMMPRYGRASSSAKVKISTTGLEDEVNYILPLTIDKVSGTDKWSLTDSPCAYIFFKKAYVSPDAGSGTKEDPYNLYTAKDLTGMKNLLTEGKITYFQLKNDIDMSEVTNWEPLNWESPYKLGVDFNGNGFTISNFTSEFSSYPSFFGVLYGRCHDVNFTNAVIESAVGGATGIVGSYCGTTDLPAEAIRIHVQGRVSSVGGNKNGTGGLFGRIWGANITACSADIQIESGEDYVGGIFGYDTGASTVSDCWTKGKVKAGSKVGGIGGGFIKAESALYNCYSLMEVEGSFQVAGILGHANLDQKSANETNEPGNHVERCIAWNSSVAATPTDGNEHYSSGIIVGFTALQNYLVDCFYKPGISFAEGAKNTELGYKAYDQQNSGPGNPLVHGSNTYDFAYHGKAAPSGKTLSEVAKSLGWSNVVWDLSGEVPTLKAPSGSEDDTPNPGGQLPDFDENEFYK